MKSDNKDAARLWDMLTYAREICDGAVGLPFAKYLADADKRMATERRLEIIGEAARNVSDAFKTAHAEIPWRAIIGLRNVLAHEYGEIRQERIFEVIREEIPKLIALLEPLVPPPPAEDEP